MLTWGFGRVRSLCATAPSLHTGFTEDSKRLGASISGMITRPNPVLTVAPSGKTKLRTGSETPLTSAHFMVTGRVAAEEAVPKAIAIAGLRFM